MRKISIIYGTTTGNTRRAAEIIKDLLKEDEVTIVNSSDVKDTDITDADLIILGSATYGYGELQDEFMEFYDSKMTRSLFKGKTVAVYSCGNITNHRETFALAGDTIKEQALEIGANVIGNLLKVDGLPKNNMEDITDFVESLKTL